MKADIRCASGKGWRAVVGKHEGSKVFEDVLREMRRLRREEYEKAADQDAGSQE